MTKHITITLTEDQANCVKELVDIYCRANNLRSYKPMNKAEQKEYAFIQRIYQIINAELVK